MTPLVAQSTADARLQVAHPVIDHWLVAVNDHDLEQVCSLYLPDAILLPTLSQTIRDTPGSIRDYFVQFLAKPGLRASLEHCYVQEYSEIKIDSGVYLFTWQENGHTKAAKARFTFVIKDNKIAEHHSSLVPF